jgi:hypothetical protein
MNEEKIIAELEQYRNDPCVNSIQNCKEQIEYNETHPAQSSFMQKFLDIQTEALRRLLKELEENK